jgi:hypothetical protein
MVCMHMPGTSYAGPLPELTQQEVGVRRELRRHVASLADGIGERHVWRPAALRETAEYIAGEFAGLGYVVTRQEYVARGVEVANLEATLAPGAPGEALVVVGAHYDSVAGCPAANDNGSGVAALLELARLLRGTGPQRPVRFVAFVNEEPPFFHTDLMGSRQYARRMKERGEEVAGMVALETIGYYADEPGSQRYPFPFGLFYPDTGSFIGFVGNLNSRRLTRRCVASFRRHTRFPSEGTVAPGWLSGMGWSDHWSFWQEGYPALMVTDTAPYRYPYYHTPDDTPERLDYGRMSRVVCGLARVVAELAGCDRSPTGPPD